MKKRKIKNRYRISDELWKKIEPLLPKHPNTHRFGGGRPRVPDRKATQSNGWNIFCIANWLPVERIE